MNNNENNDIGGYSSEGSSGSSQEFLSRLVYTIRSKNIDSTVKELLITRAQSLSDQVVAVCQLLSSIHDSSSEESDKEKSLATEEVARVGLASLMASETALRRQFDEYMEVLYAKELGTRPRKDRMQ